MEVLLQVLVNAKVSNDKKYKYLENDIIKNHRRIKEKFAGLKGSIRPQELSL